MATILLCSVFFYNSNRNSDHSKRSKKYAHIYIYPRHHQSYTVLLIKLLQHKS